MITQSGKKQVAIDCRGCMKISFGSVAYVTTSCAVELENGRFGATSKAKICIEDGAEELPKYLVFLTHQYSPAVRVCT